MPNTPTVGVFIPGFLNTTNSPGPSGQQDAYGQNYPSGLTPGKVIEVSASEARSVAAPNTNLFDGAYQYVLLDSGATSALATQGFAAYIRLDSGASQGGLPMTEFENATVTTADQLATLGLPTASLFAGIFVNPATVNGTPNAPTPGNYTFLFVGAGRATVNYTAAAAAGNQVTPSGAANGEFTSAAPGAAVASVYPQGIALQAGTPGVALFQDLFYRIANQGV
jgi:hypothetical protein